MLAASNKILTVNHLEEKLAIMHFPFIKMQYTNVVMVLYT